MPHISEDEKMASSSVVRRGILTMYVRRQIFALPRMMRGVQDALPFREITFNPHSRRRTPHTPAEVFRQRRSRDKGNRPRPY